ncbi:hypothetical protein [Nocardia lasii]|uniref:Uncharacterized protein n=1 Tax=Nocardia lasii TaxID=1616107 RepID=A0ABW1JNZ3_9NOCA
MTRSAIRRAVAVIGAGGALAGAVVAGAGVANAVEVPKYGNVRYVFCSDAQEGNEITYYDGFGKRDEVVTLTDPMEGGRWCRNVDVLFASSSFVWSSIRHDEASYAFTAIYVNGALKAREEDRSSYGYAAAMAM